MAPFEIQSIPSLIWGPENALISVPLSFGNFRGGKNGWSPTGEERALNPSPPKQRTLIKSKGTAQPLQGTPSKARSVNLTLFPAPRRHPTSLIMSPEHHMRSTLRAGRDCEVDPCAIDPHVVLSIKPLSTFLSINGQGFALHAPVFRLQTGTNLGS